MNIDGIHHITLIGSDAQRTVDFYTRLLGLRLVKKTVNFDDPGSYHLYFGDATGSPGSIVTYFIVPGARRGRAGFGGTHHYALTVSDGAALRKWKRWLTDNGVRVNGPLDRHYFESLYFQDPDGAIIELATAGPGWAIDEEPDSIGTEHRTPPAEMIIRNRDHAAIAADTHEEPVTEITPDMALTRGMHHITAIGGEIERIHDFYHGVLGLKLVKQTDNFDSPDSRHWYWANDRGEPGSVITYFEHDPRRSPPTIMGAGQTHHIALSVKDDETQAMLSERLAAAGYRVSPVLDRTYFKSVYSADPHGMIVEIATAGPGFAVDEDPASLGQELMLPEQLEPHRQDIERVLQPLSTPEWIG